MKDSQIDLGGRLGCAEEQDYPLLAPEQPFCFSCAGCGDCCRDRKDIVLSGCDLHRICARLRLPAAVVIRGYCCHSTGAVTGLPVVRLQPLSEESGNCPFLYKKRCAIHDAKPLVCALYPLAQQIDTDTGAVSYCVQPTGCGGPEYRATCADYLDSFGIRQRQPVDVQWAVECTALSRRVLALRPGLHPAQRKMLDQKLFRLLYLSIDGQQPYPPQQTDAFAQANAYLDKVAARCSSGAPMGHRPG